jgi:hypothetical protein
MAVLFKYGLDKVVNAEKNSAIVRWFENCNVICVIMNSIELSL